MVYLQVKYISKGKSNWQGSFQWSLQVSLQLLLIGRLRKTLLQKRASTISRLQFLSFSDGKPGWEEQSCCCLQLHFCLHRQKCRHTAKACRQFEKTVTEKRHQNTFIKRSRLGSYVPPLYIIIFIEVAGSLSYYLSISHNIYLKKQYWNDQKSTKLMSNRCTVKWDPNTSRCVKMNKTSKTSLNLCWV